MKTAMKKVAKTEVKSHEKKMHGKKYQAGGMTGLGRAAAMSGREMPEQAGRGNAGGAMRGLERAAAMSGRDFSGMGRPATAGRPVGMKTGGVARGNPSTPGGQGQMQAGKLYKAGGKIDGCATKGKTKATMVKMSKGGKS